VARVPLDGVEPYDWQFMTYDEIVQGLRDSTYELQNEGRLVRAGLKVQQDTVSIIERYAWLYSNEALDIVREPRDEAGRRVRAAIAQGIIERRTAPQQDRLATFYANAKARVGDEEIPFFTAQAQLVREADPGRREALGESIGTVMEEADGLQLELQAAILDVIRDFGYECYTDFYEALKEVSYGQLRAELSRVAELLRSRYRAWVEPRMARSGHLYGECPQAHMGFIRGLPEHEAVFSRERFEPAMRRTFESLGLELFTAPTIHLDLEDRPAKNPRASVWVPEAGREVHLLTRPSGGNRDYSAFLHEAGHALHFGLTDPGIGWPLANIGRSMAYAELWSFLFEHIGHDPVWIAEATGVDERRAEQVAVDLAGVDLMLFMRYVGKFNAELDLYAGDPLDPTRGRQVFTAACDASTGFRYDPRAWQFDRDPGFYSADYLRAWLAEAALERWLRREYGPHWWKSRDAGEWLRRQWREGWLPEAEEVVAKVGETPWSGDALVERVEERLAVAA
jgi:hypothetical protein